MAGQSTGIKHGQKVPGDEVAGVAGLACVASQRVLQRRERANASTQLDPCPPQSGRQVHPSHRRPAKRQEPAQHDEQDERAVKDDDEVGQEENRSQLAAACSRSFSFSAATLAATSGGASAYPRNRCRWVPRPWVIEWSVVEYL